MLQTVFLNIIHREQLSFHRVPATRAGSNEGFGAEGGGRAVGDATLGGAPNHASPRFVRLRRHARPPLSPGTMKMIKLNGFTCPVGTAVRQMPCDLGY